MAGNLVITWQRFHDDTLTLAARLAPLGPWRGIAAISRGGLVPAAILARALNIRLVETISIVTYDRNGAGERVVGQPEVIKVPEAAGDGTGFLIVDDLVDSGTTARAARALLPRARFVCVYAKPAGLMLADDVLICVSQDTWIVLPWETDAVA